MTIENRFRVPQKLWDIAEKKAKEYGIEENEIEFIKECSQ